jgi:hypothetical protein
MCHSGSLRNLRTVGACGMCFVAALSASLVSQSPMGPYHHPISCYFPLHNLRHLSYPSSCGVVPSMKRYDICDYFLVHDSITLLDSISVNSVAIS